MRILPVLDLMGGQVVRARHGDRTLYRPIETPLAADASPDNVAAGLMGLAPFRSLYIADIDSIEGRPDNRPAIDRLASLHPAAEIWVDGGAADRDHLATFSGSGRLRPVIGSESLKDIRVLQDLGPLPILSLDFRGNFFVGPPGLLARTELWPRDVIVMTLARVGSDAGPDFHRLRAILAAAGPDRQVYAAGGVRGEDDLKVMEALGIAGALVATALHDGRFSAEALVRWAG